jgi:hypothetical protein
MLWSEFRRGLSNKDRQRLVLAIRTALRECSAAAEIIEDDGDLDDLRRRAFVAHVWLDEARQILEAEAGGEGP